MEYNIIIEALSCAVQNQQQAEVNEGQANFEFVVINNTSDEQGQSTLDCIEQSPHEDEHLATQVTFQSADNTSASTNDAAGTEGQDPESTQATEAIRPREKNHKCDVCNKTFLHAGRIVSDIYNTSP